VADDRAGPPGTTTATGSGRAKLSPATRRRVKHIVQLVALIFAVNYLVLPQLARLDDAIAQLTDIRASLLFLGVGLQMTAFLAYSQLTRECLPPGCVSLPRMVRIQFSTRGLASIVPGGNAAASALGYRLLTMSGVNGADAGFALATAGLGSAVLLNIVLWVGLLISIPLRGFNPLYVTAAVIGVFLIGVFFGVVLSLVWGRDQSVRVVRAVARRFRVVDEDRAEEVVHRLADRLRDLLADKVLLRRVVIWGTLNWLLDAASLWVFIYAYGSTLSLDGLLVSFGLANLFAAVPITPGGLGIVESVYIPTLAAFGVPVPVAAIAVPTYRLAQYWFPMILGALSYASLRVGPVAIRDGRRLERFRDVAVDALEHPESSIDWAERYGHRPQPEDGTRPLPPRALPPPAVRATWPPPPPPAPAKLSAPPSPPAPRRARNLLRRQRPRRGLANP
jgi:uncharacterized protein (TIRG00374 family)